MPLFVCDKCDTIDNTACGGTYWGRDADYWPKETRGKVLCAECAPTHFASGEARMQIGDRKPGQWHDLFERTKMTDEKARKEATDYIYLGRFEYLRGK